MLSNPEKRVPLFRPSCSHIHSLIRKNSRYTDRAKPFRWRQVEWIQKPRGKLCAGNVGVLQVVNLSAVAVKQQHMARRTVYRPTGLLRHSAASWFDSRRSITARSLPRTGHVVGKIEATSCLMPCDINRPYVHWTARCTQSWPRTVRHTPVVRHDRVTTPRRQIAQKSDRHKRQGHRQGH